MAERAKKAQNPAPPHVAQAPTIQPADVAAQYTGVSFQRVKLDQPVNEPDRDEPGALVSPSGFTRTNTGGHLAFDELARIAGLEPTNFAVEYGVNEARQQVAFYAVSRQTAGAAAIRRDMERQITTLLLKPIFKKYVDLRIKVRKQCDLVLTKDDKGEDCLVLALGTGLDKPVRRKSAKA